MSPESLFVTILMLRRLFGALVERTFLQTLGVYEPGVTDYLADVLTDFAHMKHVYKVKDLQGRPLEEVADMLLQADVRLQATSFNREREVHKHIGDFTLFWAGVYPEALPRLQARSAQGPPAGLRPAGQEQLRHRRLVRLRRVPPAGPVLRKLSDEFELCLYGLHMVRKEMDGLARAA